jgi:hypothetical protein
VFVAQGNSKVTKIDISNLIKKLHEEIAQLNISILALETILATKANGKQGVTHDTGNCSGGKGRLRCLARTC